MPPVSEDTRSKLPKPLQNPINVSASAAAILALIAGINFAVKSPVSATEIRWRQAVETLDGVSYNPNQFTYQYTIYNPDPPPEANSFISSGMLTGVSCEDLNHEDGWDCKAPVSQIYTSFIIDEIELELKAILNDSLVSSGSEKIRVRRALITP